MRKLKKLGIIFGVVLVLFIVVGSSGNNSTRDTDSRTVDDNQDFIQRFYDENPIAQPNVIIPDKQRFDPVLTAAATESLPAMRDFVKGILEQCEDVRTSSDYVTFATMILILQDDIADNLTQINVVIRDLESKGYNEHPIIGSLIREMKNMAGESDSCMSGLVILYG